MSGNVATVNTTSIQLVLVDDHAMFRQGLARVLEKEPGFKVTGQFASSAEALEALQENGATMVLLDVDLGPERAVDFVEEAKKRGFAGKILVVTAGVAPQQAVELVESGVAGIVHKHHSIEMLCGTIRKWRPEKFIWKRNISLLCTVPSTEPRRTSGRGSPSGKGRSSGSYFRV